MKILLVCEDLPAKVVGGLGKHVVALGNALINSGHLVALMGHNELDYSDCEDEIGFDGKFIAGFDNPIKGWKERQLGFFNPFRRSYFAKRLAAAIIERASDYDVVHYHGHLPMVGMYIPKNINFIQTRHDQGGDCITNVRFKNGDVCVDRNPVSCAECVLSNPGILRRKLSSIAVSRYRRETAQSFAMHPVIFVSEFLRENFLKSVKVDKFQNMHVIHNFVNEKLLSSIKSKSPTANIFQVRVHIAGRIDESKGIAALLSLLVPQMPSNWHIDVYGDGPQRSTAVADFAGAAVTFHGHTLYRKTVEATRDASVVVVPSVWEEPCGTVILEALRVGKICYALSRGGTPELTRYGAPGQLRLFENLPTLVTALVSSSDFMDQSGGDSADVSTVLPQLINLYLGGIRNIGRN